MPEVHDAITRMHESQILKQAAPLVRRMIDEEVAKVDATLLGAVRGRRLDSEMALAICHEKAALDRIKTRMRVESLVAGPTKEQMEKEDDPQTR